MTEGRFRQEPSARFAFGIDPHCSHAVPLLAATADQGCKYRLVWVNFIHFSQSDRVFEQREAAGAHTEFDQGDFEPPNHALQRTASVRFGFNLFTHGWLSLSFLSLGLTQGFTVAIFAPSSSGMAYYYDTAAFVA